MSRDNGTLTLVEKTAFLKGIKLLASIPTEALADLASRAREVYCEPGETLFQEGDPDRGSFLCVEGLLQLRKGRAVVRVLQPGTALGELWLGEGEPHQYSLIAIERSHLLNVTREDVNEAMLDYPEFGAAMVRMFALRVHELNGRVLDLEIRGLEAVAARIDGRTRLVLVISPHNPTGAVIEPDEMAWLHDVCVRQGAPFVCDQVYHPIYHGKSQLTAARLPGAIVLGDFSKALCLSGLRVGWIVERDPVRRERLADARAYFTISNSALGEALAVHAMQHRQAILERAHRIATRNLHLLEAFFARHRDVFGWTRPAGGFTAFPWLTDGADTMELCTALNAEGIGLVPGRCLQAPTHFRIGFGASGERFAEGLAALDAFVVSWFSKRDQSLRARE